MPGTLDVTCFRCLAPVRYGSVTLTSLGPVGPCCAALFTTTPCPICDGQAVRSVADDGMTDDFCAGCGQSYATPAGLSEPTVRYRPQWLADQVPAPEGGRWLS